MDGRGLEQRSESHRGQNHRTSETQKTEGDVAQGFIPAKKKRPEAGRPSRNNRNNCCCHRLSVWVCGKKGTENGRQTRNSQPATCNPISRPETRYLKPLTCECIMQQKTTSRIELQETLERNILHGLSLEWDHALWVLDEPERQKMNKPLLSLRDMGRKLGTWSEEKNEITLSREHVLKCPWDDTREILIHEMAHQYADQVLGAKDETPHGPLFRQACLRLRANPSASGQVGTLHERLQNKSRDRHDRHLVRIKKLMSLAESKNRHEAEAAMAKAHDLMKKYNLKVLEQSRPREFVSVFVGKPALRHFRESYYIANLLQDYYFVQGLWVSAYVLEKGKMGRVLEISGTRRNIKIATYVYAFVNRYIDSQWQTYSRGKKLNRHRKSDFAVGLVEGFTNKLARHEKAQRADRSPEARALVKFDDPLLGNYMAHRYPHTRSFSRKTVNHDTGILADGFKVGEKMVISKGIAHSGSSASPSAPKLLTA